MSTKHTPGPWFKGEVVNYGGGQKGHAINFGDDGECIVDYVYTEADADLIAAAPDLLAACMRVADSAMRNGAYDACIAAIAKATGGDQ